MDAAAVEYELCLNQISLDKFQGFRSLHGNYMTYARLLLPGILAGVDRFLYLDSDLVVGTDVAALFQTEMQHRPIAAAGGQTVANALEKPFFLSIGLPETNPYFNAGVLLFNTIQWRQDNWTQRCLEFCQKYPDELKAADQTVLNALLGREYLPVDPRFNLTLYPDNARLTPEQARNKIIHFVGSPKPWDLLGNQLHKNSPIFRQYFEKTALAGRWGLHPRSLLRASRLARSYYKAFKALRRP